MRPLTANLCTLGLLVLTLPVAHAQPSQAGFEITDPRGDVTVGAFRTIQPATAPSSAATDSADMIALRARESLLSVQLEIAFADLEALRTNYAAFTEFEIGFETNPATAKYRILGFGPTLGYDTRPRSTMLCAGSQCTYDGPIRIVDEKNDVYRLDFTKEFFLGRANGKVFSAQLAQAPLPASLQLTNWKVEVMHATPAGVPSFVDTLDSSTPFALALGIPNQDLLLTGPEGPAEVLASRFRKPYEPVTPDVHPVGVALGTVTPLVLEIENRENQKRLVNLSATFATPEEADGFRLRMPPAIEVPGGQRRNLTVFVEAAQEVKHRDRATVTFVASALGTAKVGATVVTLVAISMVGVGEPILHLHAGNTPEDCNAAICGGSSAWMNVQQDDSAANLDESSVMYMNGWASNSFSGVVNILGDTPVGKDLRLDPAKPAILKMTFSARTEFRGRLQATVSLVEPCFGNCSELVTLGSNTVDATISTTPTAIDVPIPINPDQTRIPAGNHYLQLRVYMTSSEPATVVNYGGLNWHPGRSTLGLPIVADPGTSSPLGNIRLYHSGEAEEFVNPGRTRLFQVRLANEGAEPETATLAVVNDKGWPARIEPARAFVLQPGESANVGAFVTAPAEAKEGDSAVIVVNATSATPGGAGASLRLHLTATSGVEITDQNQPFQVDDDTRARAVVDVPQKSPGAGLVGAVVATLAVCLYYGRRR